MTRKQDRRAAGKTGKPKKDQALKNGNKPRS